MRQSIFSKKAGKDLIEIYRLERDGVCTPSQRFDVAAFRAIHTKRFGRGKYPVRNV
jgi:hypothetical protein